MLLSTPTLLQELNVRSTDPVVLQRYDALRQGVEQAVKSYVKWPIEGQAHCIEYYSGQNFPDIVLNYPYVSKLWNVWFDSQGFAGQNTNNYTPFAASTLLTRGADYMLMPDGPNNGGVLGKSGLLRRLNSQTYFFPSDLVWLQSSGGLAYHRANFWPAGYGNAKVEYDWGFLSIGNPGSVITGVTWSGGVATYTTASNHILWPGTSVTISGVAPGGWNSVGTLPYASSLLGAFQVTGTPTATTFTVTMASDPGAYVSGGVVENVPYDVKLAICTAVSIAKNSVLYGYPVQSENLGDYSYSLNIQRPPEFASVRQLLSAYRNQAVMGLS